MHRYRNRRAAGRALAGHLREHAGRPDAVVLALPRGGAPVGFELARELNLPWDVFVVRKLGAPGQEELAMGAIASGGVRILNEEVIQRAGVSAEEIERAVSREREELQRRERAYRGDRPGLDVERLTVILTDDGLATGATMRAAVQALVRAGARRIIVAAPVGSIEAVERLEEEADEVVCPFQPVEFQAVGAWYDDFGQVSDAEVRALLAEKLPIPI